MKLAFTGDINFRNYDKITCEQSKSILAEIKAVLNDVYEDIAEVW